MSAPQSRRRPVDGDAIREEVAERIEEATRDAEQAGGLVPGVDPDVAAVPVRPAEPAPLAPPFGSLPADLIAPMPAAAAAVTAQTPFRQIGDLPIAVWQKVLGEAGSPLLLGLESSWYEAEGYGALALAQAYKESSLGKNAPAGTNNPLGLLDYTGTKPVKMVNGLPFRVFNMWSAAFEEFRYRLSDLSYKAGAYGPQNLSLEGFIVTYVAGPGCLSSRGATCANGERWVPGGDRNAGSVNLYLAQTTERINAWRALGGITPVPPPPAETDPYRIIMGGDYPAVTYGWLADAGLNYYGFGVGHGTQRATQHTGDDIPVACGTSLYAPAAGVVDCVGAAGAPRWGQGCGAYGDVDGGGKGNLTILLDGSEGASRVKLTLGHVRDVFVKPGDRVHQGQRVATVGSMNGCHVHIETSIERNGTYWLIAPKPALASLIASAPTPPVDPRAGLKHWNVPGTPRGIWMPPDITVLTILTPMGPNRQGLPLQANGTVYHQTGNRGVGQDARRHAEWQRDGTQGHPNNVPGGPNIGVHAYTGNRTVVITLPWNEQGIHSGDGRNQTRLAFEECINADRDAALTERTTAYLHATAIRDVIGDDGRGADDVTPHACNHCPTILCTSGRWDDMEDRIVELIGGALPEIPVIEYAPVSKVPVEWSGEDVEIGGHTFVAIRRVFRAAQNDVPALQYADPKSKPVRRALPNGEGFEAVYIVKGSDDRPWFVTRFASRIPADQCEPKVSIGGLSTL